MFGKRNMTVVIARLRPKRRKLISNLVHLELNTTYEVEIMRLTNHRVHDYVAYKGIQYNLWCNYEGQSKIK